MKYLILAIFILCLISSCNSKKQNEIAGIWDATSYLEYPFDTISLDFPLDTDIEKMRVKTDSGIMAIEYIGDSVISVYPSTEIDVLHIHLDNKTNGVLSFYTLDIEQETQSKEEPRWTANNFSFHTISIKDQNCLIIDYHFHQYGRALDTVEYQILSSSKLILDGDTLSRIEKP